MEHNEQMKQLMEQFKPPSEEDLQMTIISLQQQLANQIGAYTNLDVQRLKLQNKNAELEKELEEYRNKEIEDMDKGGKTNAKK